MALTLGDNFSYLGAKPLDGRVKYDTIAQMAAMSASTLYDGIIAYCVADGKNYQWKSTNDVDATLGKWRELASGGGGETYSDFTGATSSTAGAHGLVPAPSAGDEGKVLFGNGLWGALPSVDLSVLSNEAFIFDTSEKPVGMWTDRKILYAKTIENTFSAQQTEDWHTVGNLGTNADTKFVFGHFTNLGANHIWNVNSPRGEVSTLVNLNTTGQVSIRTPSMGESSLASITAFYTKTTDSPLPSDVKFAGVTASGEVILEKNIDYGSTISIPSSGFTSIGMDATNIKMILYAYGYHTDDARCCPLVAIKDNNLVKCIVARDGSPMDLRYFTIRYTTTS